MTTYFSNLSSSVSGKFLSLTLAAVPSFLTGCAVAPTPAPAKPSITYILNQAAQFGTADAVKGTFTQVGAGITEPSQGLALASDGTLLTMGFSGTVYAINLATGGTKAVGNSGLDDCSIPGVSPCGPTSSFNVAALGAGMYADDFASNLYSLNPTTAKATLIGYTGIPASPYVAGGMNKDGSFNFVDTALFAANGKLYKTFSATIVNFATGQITPVVRGSLYTIDPATAHATFVASIPTNITAVGDVDGTIYAYDAAHGEWDTLDLSTGKTTKVSADANAANGPVTAIGAVPAN